MSSLEDERRLAEHLQDHADVMPMWAAFPSISSGSIGWRMGAGESHRYLWWSYIQTLADHEARLAYLRRHPPAPVPWAGSVHSVLHPDAPDDEEPEVLSVERYVVQGLVAHDVAIENFAASVARGDECPPAWIGDEELVDAARYDVRSLWFHGRLHHRARRLAGTRPSLEPSPKWAHLAEALRSGSLPELDPTRGLESLAMACAAGEVPGPWSIGMTLGDFEDSFDRDMNYVDAYRLWAMECLDDATQVQRFVAAQGASAEWLAWLGREALG